MFERLYVYSAQAQSWVKQFNWAKNTWRGFQNWAASDAGQLTSNVANTVSIGLTVAGLFPSQFSPGLLLAGELVGAVGTVIDCAPGMNLNCAVGMAGLGTAGLARVVGGSPRLMLNVWSFMSGVFGTEVGWLTWRAG